MATTNNDEKDNLTSVLYGVRDLRLVSIYIFCNIVIIIFSYIYIFFFYIIIRNNDQYQYPEIMVIIKNNKIN